jgi:two-component system, OmpR family, sensor histidine kinase MprB
MSLRKRLTIIAAASVAIAVLLALVASYAVVRSQLRGSVDNSLRAQAEAVQNYGLNSLHSQIPGIPASAGGPAQYVQIYAGSYGMGRSGNIALPIVQRTRQIAAGHGRAYLSDFQVGDNHLREITFPLQVPLQDGSTVTAAVQLARPLNSVDSVLSHLRLILALLFLGGTALAALMGRMASRRVLRPLGEVAEAAQHIEATEDLHSRLHVHADDEVGQLATNFNAMLDRLETSRDALDESVRAQRQLVADASHELRTPVTSLRTNIEVLLAGGELEPEDRRRLLADVVEQSEELSALVNDLIELARGDQPGPDTDDVRLDRLAAESLARARRNAPGIRFDAELTPALVDGVPERLGRAINNLLDNAARHSPPGGIVEVRVGAEGVQVRDHGTGVAEADLPYVFDRFFRGTNSRGRQGSGLGLAIVRQVTEQHGGTASVVNAPDGGAIFTMALPTTTDGLLEGETGEAGTDETGEPTGAVKPAGGTRSLWVS